MGGVELGPTAQGAITGGVNMGGGGQSVCTSNIASLFTHCVCMCVRPLHVGLVTMSNTFFFRPSSYHSRQSPRGKASGREGRAPGRVEASPQEEGDGGSAAAHDGVVHQREPLQPRRLRHGGQP